LFLLNLSIYHLGVGLDLQDKSVIALLFIITYLLKLMVISSGYATLPDKIEVYLTIDLR